MAFCFFLIDYVPATTQQSHKIRIGRSNITSSTYESLLARASHEEEENFIYAELCDQRGSECTGKRYLTESDCFDWSSTTTKALRIHASPAKSSLSFTLYTTSIGQTCPDQVLASQYIRKPF